MQTLNSSLSKGLVAIFFVTFFIVFLLFTKVEPHFICKDSPGSLIPSCTLSQIGGDFIIYLIIVGMLFLFDMILVYYLLWDLMT